MTDAPARIWAWISTVDDHPHDPEPQNEWVGPSSPAPMIAVAYTRSDLCPSSTELREWAQNLHAPWCNIIRHYADAIDAANGGKDDN